MRVHNRYAHLLSIFNFKYTIKLNCISNPSLDGEEECVQSYYRSGWNDQNCEDELSFVCEITALSGKHDLLEFHED